MAQDKPSVVRRPQTPQSSSRSVVTPIFPSVVYASTDADALDDQYEGRASGYTYAREGHPNADVLAQKIDQLEGASGGMITGSGMSAIGAIYLALLGSGDHVIAGDQLYGRNLRLLTDDLPRQGIDVSFVDACDPAAVSGAIRPETRLVVVETISNPTLRVVDIKALARICRKAGVLLVVDNTFATPGLVTPLALGADIVMHSVTKLLAGHSDVTLGYVAARDPEISTALNTTIVSWGMTPSPFDCWLAERGLQSFDLRFERAQANAETLATALSAQNGVTSVLYPARMDHPDRSVCHDLLGGKGGTMLSFTLDGGRDEVNRFLRAAGAISFAPTLGDITTMISHPASSSHRALTADQRLEMGIPEAFFRVSVGVEDITLLVKEFTNAIAEAMP